MMVLAASGQLLNHCYVYNPTTDTWSAELPLPTAVLQGAGGTVNSGDIWKFVVASGYTGSAITDATQIYTVDYGWIKQPSH